MAEGSFKPPLQLLLVCTLLLCTKGNAQIMLIHANFKVIENERYFCKIVKLFGLVWFGNLPGMFAQGILMEHLACP